jgi:aspartyl-tRNA(Asn)/glutamyl-tRNA(Gln) amidotransferase subunit C
MSFTEADIAKIAKLARIRLSSEERAHYAKEMTSILGWIEQLQAVNTDGVVPLASVSNQTLPWRKDEVSDGGMQKEILANAPMQNYGCFAVPKVIE